MVPKHRSKVLLLVLGFRAVLFRMVPKLYRDEVEQQVCFRAVLFRMVPKL